MTANLSSTTGMSGSNAAAGDLAEEPLVRRTPVGQRPVALPLETGVLLVDLVERDHLDLRGVDQRTRVASAVERMLRLPTSGSASPSAS